MDFILTPIFTGLLGSTIGATAAGVVAPILSGLVLLAGEVLLGSLFGPKGPKPEDGHEIIQQPVPYRISIIGRARVAGAAMLLEGNEGGTGVTVGALAGHRVTAFNRFYLHDDVVTIDVDGRVSSLGDGRYGDGKIHIYYRYGEPTETHYTEISDVITTAVWPLTARGDGQASLACKFADAGADNQYVRFPHGRPQCSAEVDGAVVWDPRDEDQDPDDPSTWLLSYNAVLCAYYYECFDPLGPLQSYSTVMTPIIEDIKDFADICDETINLKAGGTQRRYEIGGWFTSETEPSAVRANILSAFDGHWCRRGDGTVVIRPGKYYEPVVEIDDSDIIGFYFQNGVADEEAVNFLELKFNSPDHGYTMIGTTPWQDEDDQTDRGRRITKTLELSWCQHFARTRRVGKREYTRQREMVRGSLQLFLSGMNACFERYVRVRSTRVPFLDNQVIEISSARISLATDSCTIEFIRATSSIDTWVPATDEGEAPPVPFVPVGEQPPQPTNVNVTVQRYGTGVALLTSWDEPIGSNFDTDELDAKIRWRLSTGPGPWSSEVKFSDPELTGGGTRRQVLLTGPPSETTVDLEVASLKGSTPSPWSSTITNIDTSEDIAATSPPSSFHVDPAGSGQAEAFWVNAAESNYRYTRIFRVLAGGGFSASTPWIGPFLGAPGASVSHTGSASTGVSYDYFAVSYNNSGVPSTAAGPDECTAV